MTNPEPDVRQGSVRSSSSGSPANLVRRPALGSGRPRGSSALRPVVPANVRYLADSGHQISVQPRSRGESAGRSGGRREPEPAGRQGAVEASSGSQAFRKQVVRQTIPKATSYLYDSFLYYLCDWVFLSVQFIDELLRLRQGGQQRFTLQSASRTQSPVTCCLPILHLLPDKRRSLM